jgi:SAM-dependent methyltransferase
MDAPLDAHRRDWEELARADPLWAVASSPEHRYGRWDEDAFYAAGERKVAKLVQRLDGLGLPVAGERALDFGCGAGRLTLPLSQHFAEVVGVDIAPAMLERARARAAGREDVRFVLDPGDLSSVTGSFALVYTGLVLQHQPSGAHMQATLTRLGRLVAPGGTLVAQLPTWLSRRARLQPSRRVYALLRRLGVPADALYARTGLQPMRMTALPRPAAEACLREAGLTLVAADERRRPQIVSATLYATHR